MLSPTELRDRLTKHSYVSSKTEDLSFRLDKALTLLATIEPIQKKLHKALQGSNVPRWYEFKERIKAAQLANMISSEEAHILNEFESLRNEIIKVNEFSFDLNEVIA